MVRLGALRGNPHEMAVPSHTHRSIQLAAPPTPRTAPRKSKEQRGHLWQLSGVFQKIPEPEKGLNLISGRPKIGPILVDLFFEPGSLRLIATFDAPCPRTGRVVANAPFKSPVAGLWTRGRVAERQFFLEYRKYLLENNSRRTP